MSAIEIYGWSFLATLLLIISILYFLKDYSSVISGDHTKKHLFVNVSSLLLAIVLLLLGVVYIIIVNKQF